MPCNFHLRGLAAHIEACAAYGYADGVQHDRRDHDGHRRDEELLVSREVIADLIELTARGYQFDADRALRDKTILGCVMRRSPASTSPR